MARKSPLNGRARPLLQISSELAKLGHITRNGKAFSASQVARLIGRE